MSDQADWTTLGDRCYRKREFAKMEWEDIDLALFRVAGAKYGGPVALLRDPKVSLKVGQVPPANDRIYIYSSGGRLLSEIPWEGEEPIAEFGWNDSERLVCMQTDGVALVYDIHGEYLYQFTTHKMVREERVAKCCIWGTGCVILTEVGHRLFWVSNFSDPHTELMPDPYLAEAPTCMTVIEPHLTGNDAPEVLLSTRSGSVLVVDMEDSNDMDIDSGPFNNMVCSADGKFLACFSGSGQVLVYSSDFRQNIMEFNTKTTKKPHQVVWCGVDIVVLAYDKIMFCVGPAGDWINFRFDERFVLVAEDDGVRIVSSKTCEFLQRVPDCTVDVFEPGSTKPAALLYDAHEELFERQSAKADDQIRGIRDALPAAVETCIQAATHAPTVEQQKKLLKTAAYGKYFCEFYDSTEYVETCHSLRILNAVHDPAVGIYITHEQYKRLSPEVMIDRLILRRHYRLAKEICLALGISTQKVAVQWAITKVKTEDAIPDERLVEALVPKLDQCPGGSFVDVARAAEEVQRHKLAVMLLNYEPSATRQVPFLISMKEDQLALQKALESGDTNLAHVALYHLYNPCSCSAPCAHRKFSKPEFFRVLQEMPAAGSLYATRLRANPDSDKVSEELKTYYYGISQPGEAAVIGLVGAYKMDSLGKRLRQLELQMEYLHQDKNWLFSAKATEDQIKLLAIQRELELNCDGAVKYIDLPLADTIYKCIERSEEKKALKLKNEFKVTDKRYAWIKLKAVVATKQWSELDKMSKEKRPPIGFEPFVLVCYEAKEFDQATAQVPKIPDALDRCRWYGKLKNYDDAMRTAVQAKNLQLLEEAWSEVPAKQRERLADTYRKARSQLGA